MRRNMGVKKFWMIFYLEDINRDKILIRKNIEIKIIPAIANPFPLRFLFFLIDINALIPKLNGIK